MRFIFDLDDLKGKTITKAKTVNGGESIALVFTDDTCAFFKENFYGESPSIVLCEDVENHLQQDAEIEHTEESAPFDADLPARDHLAYSEHQVVDLLTEAIEHIKTHAAYAGYAAFPARLVEEMETMADGDWEYGGGESMKEDLVDALAWIRQRGGY